MSKTRIDKIIAVSKDSKIEKIARKYGRQIFMADDHMEANEIIGTTDPDIILYEYNDEVSLCSNSHEFIKTFSKQIPIIAINTGSQNNCTSGELNLEFHECLHINSAYEQLQQVIASLKQETTPQQNDQPATKDTDNLFINSIAANIGMAGNSPSAVKTARMIELVANSRCNPILVVGETGTGKELVARSLHDIRNQNQQFVALNCAALTANLLESELFGHVKGSFTGADRDKTGLLELASSGTVFLDEISEMPLELQAKLLRVLQEKTFRKVGGIKDITCNATIIASSNRNLKKEVNENRFRRDLYYRLNICPITIAPLRSEERKSDITILTEYFLKTSTICPKKEHKPLTITKMALEALNNYNWPGNVRELRNVIERAILIESTDQIGISSIIFDPDDIHEFAHETSNNQLMSFSLEKAERELISKALKETDWQKTRAASLLGITRATLYAKIKQYDIQQIVNQTNTESQIEEFAVIA